MKTTISKDKVRAVVMRTYRKQRPTARQRLAVERIVENRGNVSKSMREAGYPETTARNPYNLTKSKGFEQICQEVGLTDDFLLQALSEDIRDKPRNRRGELELGLRVRNLLKEREHGIDRAVVFMPLELMEKYALHKQQDVKQLENGSTKPQNSETGKA
jgi:hypothetical protein